MDEAGDQEPEAGEDPAALDGDAIEMAADEAILACGGDLRETIKALIVANAYLEDELTKVSYGYDRGRARARRAG